MFYKYLVLREVFIPYGGFAELMSEDCLMSIEV